MIMTVTVRDASQFVSPPDLQPNAFVQGKIEDSLVDHVDECRKRDDTKPSITTLRRTEMAVSAHKELAKHPSLWEEALRDTGFVGKNGVPDVGAISFKKWNKGRLFRPRGLPTVTRSYVKALSDPALLLQPMKYPFMVTGHETFLNPMFVGFWSCSEHKGLGELRSLELEAAPALEVEAAPALEHLPAVANAAIDDAFALTQPREPVRGIGTLTTPEPSRALVLHKPQQLVLHSEGANCTCRDCLLARVGLLEDQLKLKKSQKLRRQYGNQDGIQVSSPYVIEAKRKAQAEKETKALLAAERKLTKALKTLPPSAAALPQPAPSESGLLPAPVSMSVSDAAVHTSESKKTGRQRKVGLSLRDVNVQ
jgi:hypothetical protein